MLAPKIKDLYIKDALIAHLLERYIDEYGYLKGKDFEDLAKNSRNLFREHHSGEYIENESDMTQEDFLKELKLIVARFDIRTENNNAR